MLFKKYSIHLAEILIIALAISISACLSLASPEAETGSQGAERGGIVSACVGGNTLVETAGIRLDLQTVFADETAERQQDDGREYQVSK